MKPCAGIPKTGSGDDSRTLICRVRYRRLWWATACFHRQQETRKSLICRVRHSRLLICRVRYIRLWHDTQGSVSHDTQGSVSHGRHGKSQAIRVGQSKGRSSVQPTLRTERPEAGSRLWEML